MIGLLTWKLTEDTAFKDNTKWYPSQKFHIPYHLKKVFSDQQDQLFLCIQLLPTLTCIFYVSQKAFKICSITVDFIALLT